jgi:hypothetical protein
MVFDCLLIKKVMKRICFSNTNEHELALRDSPNHIRIKYLRVKELFYTSLRYFMIAIMVSFLTSCEPDEPNGDNNGPARDKFIGTWTCVESSNLTYTVKILASSSNESEVLLENFHHLGQNEHAIGSIAGYSITIPEQTMCDGEWDVKGSGLMTANQKTISFQYTVAGGPNLETVNATYTKQ